MEFSEQEARALLLLAGFREGLAMHRLENQYWPDHEHYDDVRRRSPWWLAMTEFGPVKIGWRKRVLSIDWRDTAAREVVTEDDVTKDTTLVHAYSYPKALQYLTKLHTALVKASPSREVS